MAQAHPGIDAITKYLRSDFPWQKPLDCSKVYGRPTTFTYEEVKEALRKLKVTDPYLHKLLGYRWQTNRARNEIADGLYLDPSTLKRGWDRAINQLMNYLINADVVADLDPIDILQKEGIE